MLPIFNSTFISLIPKVGNPSFEDWPITLCNEIYKVITKVITLRVKPILLLYVSKEQFNFLKG